MFGLESDSYGTPTVACVSAHIFRKPRLQLEHHSERRREIGSDVVHRDTTPFFTAKQIENRSHLLVPCPSAQRLAAESIMGKSEHGVRKCQGASPYERVVGHLLGTHGVEENGLTAVLG